MSAKHQGALRKGAQLPGHVQGLDLLPQLGHRVLDLHGSSSGKLQVDHWKIMEILQETHIFQIRTVMLHIDVQNDLVLHVVDIENLCEMM